MFNFFKRKLELIRQTKSLRKLFLKVSLYSAGFKQIRGHWVYVKGLQEGSLLLDFGANEGLFSSEMKNGYGCSCHLFEPNKALLGNSEFPRERIHNVALTATDGPIDFFISENPEASSISGNFQDVWTNTVTTQVEGWTFRSLVDRLGFRGKRLEIVKVDVEGAEIGFIESLTAEDLKDVVQITVEFHDWLNKDLHQPTVAVIRKLVSLGFAAYADAKSHTDVVEMLFVNKRLVRFGFFQQLPLFFFERFKYLPLRSA